MSDLTDMKKQIKDLVKKAADSDKADDAMKFSQAAVNASQALYALRDTKTD